MSSGYPGGDPQAPSSYHHVSLGANGSMGGFNPNANTAMVDGPASPPQPVNQPQTAATSTTTASFSIDEQLDSIVPEEDPLLTRLKTAAPEFPLFSNPDLNDWVCSQSSLGVDPRFTSPIERSNLKNEIDEVEAKIKSISAADGHEGNGQVDIVNLFAKVVNTHPHIHHMVYPIPSFVKALVRTACAKKANTISVSSTIQSEIATLTGYLNTARNRVDSFNDSDEDQINAYLQSLKHKGVDLAMFDTMNSIIQANNGSRPVIFLSHNTSLQSPESTLPIPERTARSIRDNGILATSKGKFIPASQQDAQIELQLLNSQINERTQQLAEAKQQRAKLMAGDFSDYPDWNPYLDITLTDIQTQLNGIKSLTDLVPVRTVYYQPPVTGTDETLIKNSVEVPLLIKTAGLNRGFGFFFQLAPDADPTINQQGGQQFILGDVAIEPVEGSISAPSGMTLEQLQPISNMENALEYRQRQSTQQQSFPERWYPSPLTEGRFQTKESKQATQSGIMKMISKYTSSNQPAQEQNIVYNFNTNAVFNVNVGGTITTAADCGACNAQIASFILTMVKSLQPDSTHFTARVYFNGVRTSLEELLKKHNARSTDGQSDGAKPPLFVNDVPLTGLYNQGVTCYLNTYLQALYGLPYLRKALFHIPVTKQEGDRPDDETFIPLCTHTDQQGDDIDPTQLTYVQPKVLNEAVGDCHKWVQNENPLVDARYCMSVREFLLRKGKMGSHVSVKGLREFGEGKEPGNGRKEKQFVYQKIINHSTTPNTAALQTLFLEMQNSANGYFKYIYAKQYSTLFGGNSPKSLANTTNPVTATHTKEVTQSFLSKQFGWKRPQLNEQQDLQELARKVTDNLEQSTYNTVVEGVTQRLFKGYYENVTRAVNVDFSKITEEAYEDLILPVRECPTLQHAFDAYQLEDEITGYKTDHPEFGVQTVKRCQRLTDKLPPILTLMLKRMDFDYTTFEQTKINSRLEFPPVLDMSFVHPSAHKDEEEGAKVRNIDEVVDDLGIDLEQYPGALNSYDSPLSESASAARKCPHHGDQSLIYDLYSVLVHAGNINSGHYINFIRPLRGTQSMSTSSDATSKFNSSYTLPSNRYQATGVQFEQKIDLGDMEEGLAGQESIPTTISPTPVDSNAQCTCNFDHNKADSYRQGDWYCFDDNEVTLSTPEDAIDANYGIDGNNRWNAGKSAYLLMYINRRYTYFDTTNSANELVFHPAVFSQIGQELLPASALPLSAIPIDQIKSIIPDVEEINNQIVEQGKDGEDNGEKMTHAAVSPPKKDDNEEENDQDGRDAPKPTQYDFVFQALDEEQTKILEQMENAQTKATYEQLQRLQQVRQDDSSFVSVYSPLPLRRVLAQKKNVLVGKSPHYNARFVAQEAQAYAHSNGIGLQQPHHQAQPHPYQPAGYDNSNPLEDIGTFQNHGDYSSMHNNYYGGADMSAAHGIGGSFPDDPDQ